MSRTHLGLLLCLSFVSLEAFQSVYLGAVFQTVDSFLVGAWVFGISVCVSVAVALYARPLEILASIRSWPIVLALNLLAATTWCTYFLAVQLIEPAVVFTIFSGMVPLGTVLGAWFGIKEADCPRSATAMAGHLIILGSVCYLGAITALGLSGFTRGTFLVGFIGATLSAISGLCTAFVVLYSVRLNSRGCGAVNAVRLALRIVHTDCNRCVLNGLGRKDPARIYSAAWLHRTAGFGRHRSAPLSGTEGDPARIDLSDRAYNGTGSDSRFCYASN